MKGLNCELSLACRSRVVSDWPLDASVTGTSCPVVSASRRMRANGSATCLPCLVFWLPPFLERVLTDRFLPEFSTKRSF